MALALLKPASGDPLAVKCFDLPSTPPETRTLRHNCRKLCRELAYRALTRQEAVPVRKIQFSVKFRHTPGQAGRVRRNRTRSVQRREGEGRGRDPYIIFLPKLILLNYRPLKFGGRFAVNADTAS